MELIGGLYTICSDCKTINGGSFAIRLNKTHFIYAAHFPGEPITPGVCILQIVAELFSRLCGVPLELSTVKNVKFLRIISPIETPEIIVDFSRLSIEEGLYHVMAVVHDENDIYAKLSLVCKQKE